VIDSKLPLRRFGSKTGHCGVGQSQVVRADQTTAVGEYKTICQHRPRITASAKPAPSQDCRGRALSPGPHYRSHKQSNGSLNRGEAISENPLKGLSNEVKMSAAQLIMEAFEGDRGPCPITTPQPGKSRNARFASPKRSGFDRCASPATDKTDLCSGDELCATYFQACARLGSYQTW